MHTFHTKKQIKGEEKEFLDVWLATTETLPWFRQTPSLKKGRMILK